MSTANVFKELIQDPEVAAAAALIVEMCGDIPHAKMAVACCLVFCIFGRDIRPRGLRGMTRLRNLELVTKAVFEAAHERLSELERKGRRTAVREARRLIREAIGDPRGHSAAR